MILGHTARAIKSLQEQLSEQREWRKQRLENDGVEEKPKEGEDGFGTLGECYAVRINSGKFGVPWEDTKGVLEAGEVDMVVLRPEAEEELEEINMAGQEQGKERGEGGDRGRKGSAKRTVGDWGGGGDGKREKTGEDRLGR